MLSPEETLNSLQKMGWTKLRGFEYISDEQWDKDCPDFERPTIIKPKRSTSKSAGYDFFSPSSFILKPNESIKIPTGIKAYMRDDEFLQIVPRSGLGFKFFVRLANTLGVVDCDYFNNPNNEGHIWVKIRNEGDTVLSISRGDAFCQGIFQKYYLADGDDSLNTRIGGFGSTDKT